MMVEKDAVEDDEPGQIKANPATKLLFLWAPTDNRSIETLQR